MVDRLPAAAAPIRIHAWYGSVGALLRELSRAVNQDRTLIHADSGLPAGTRLVLVLATDSLRAGIEVEGTVTSCRPRGRKHEMALRYDFDPGAQRARLRKALAELRRETRSPRREPRVPLALRTEITRPRGLTASIVNASSRGAMLELRGRRLPRIERGSRLVMTFVGRGARPRAAETLALEVLWLGRARRVREGWVRSVGGRFSAPGAKLRARIRAVLRFEEVRPHVRILSVEQRRPDPEPARRPHGL
jgi:hypothetical protein